MAAVKNGAFSWTPEPGWSLYPIICKSWTGISDLTYASGIIHGRPNVILSVLHGQPSQPSQQQATRGKRTNRSRSTQPNHVRLRISRSSGANDRLALGECSPNWNAAVMASPWMFHACTDFCVP